MTGENGANSQTFEDSWKGLYRIGGYAALMALAIVLIEGITDYIIQIVWLNSGSYGLVPVYNPAP